MTWGDAQGAGALQEKAPAPLPPLINRSITLFMKYIGFVGNIFHLKKFPQWKNKEERKEEGERTGGGRRKEQGEEGDFREPGPPD